MGNARTPKASARGEKHTNSPSPRSPKKRERARRTVERDGRDGVDKTRPSGVPLVLRFGKDFDEEGATSTRISN